MATFKNVLKKGAGFRIAAVLLSVSLQATSFAPAALAAPSSFGSIASSDDAKEFFNVDGSNIPQSQYTVIPASVSGPDKMKARQASVVICEQTGSDGGQCSRGSPDAHLFRLTHFFHADLSGGADYWDYTFLAEGNATLRFLYRVNPGQGPAWGLVFGETDENVEFSRNKVAGLEGFGDSDLALNVLDKQADDEGLAWAEKSGVNTSEDQSGFLERATTDPFQIAVQKMADIVNSANDAVIDALMWAVSQENLTQNILAPWKVIRDLINILFMVILIALAMITMLRIDPQKYNIRSLLPMLIFSIVFVNFSLMFANIMLSSATILSTPFVNQAKLMIMTGGNEVSAFTGGSSLGESVVLLFAAILLLLALALLLFFFIIRIVVIWLLAAASPVLFLFFVLPLTRGEGSKLLTQWIRWVYMAPIAFMLLYIGSAVPFNGPAEGSAADAIITALFYGGVIAAAVLVPLALGGKLMTMAARQGAKGAKLGGKGGLGLAGAIPLGGGMTVGELARTGKSAMELRGRGQKERADERAADAMVSLNEALGGEGLATSITGFDAGQAQPIRNSLVDKQLKNAMLGGMNEANFSRMVAYKMDQQPNLSAEERETVGKLKETWGEASQEEMRMADNKVGELAAAKGLSQTGFMGWGMMPRYARYGYQEAMSQYDPLMASVRKNYRGGKIGAEHLDMNRVGVAVGSPGSENMNKYVPDFWESVRPDSTFGRTWASADGLAAFQDTIKNRTSASGLGQIMNPTERVSASDGRRRAIGSIIDRLSDDARNAAIAGDLHSKEAHVTPVFPQNRQGGAPGGGGQTIIPVRGYRPK